MNQNKGFQILLTIAVFSISLWLLYRYFSTFNEYKSLSYLFIGFGIYSIVIFILRKYFFRSLNWLRTFTHELTHVIFIYLSGHKVEGFQATRLNGGSVHFTGKSNVFIALSPYFFPIYPLLFLLLGVLIKVEYLHYIEILVGLTYAFQLHSFYLDCRVNQTDFEPYGKGLSLPLIMLANIYFVTVITYLIVGRGYSGFYWFIF